MALCSATLVPAGVPVVGRSSFNITAVVCNLVINAVCFGNLLFFTCPVPWNFNAYLLLRLNCFLLSTHYLT